MKNVTEKNVLQLCKEMTTYFSVDNAEDKPTARPKPRRVSFIRRLSSHWTSEGIMVTEEYGSDLEDILLFLDKKEFGKETTKNLAIECNKVLKMITRYIEIHRFFNIDDMLVRKFLNQVKTLKTDLEEIVDRLGKASVTSK